MALHHGVFICLTSNLWHYIASYPYNQLFLDLEIPSAIRSRNKLTIAHPIYETLTKIRVSRGCIRKKMQNRVIPIYLGIAKQLGDHPSWKAIPVYRETEFICSNYNSFHLRSRRLSRESLVRRKKTGFTKNL